MFQLNRFRLVYLRSLFYRMQIISRLPITDNASLLLRTPLILLPGVRRPELLLISQLALRIYHFKSGNWNREPIALRWKMITEKCEMTTVLAPMFHEWMSRDHEDRRATGQPSRGTSGLVSVPKRYVAGADTRGRPEGRSYPGSQQAIHETPWLGLKRLDHCCRQQR